MDTGSVLEGAGAKPDSAIYRGMGRQGGRPLPMADAGFDRLASLTRVGHRTVTDFVRPARGRMDAEHPPRMLGRPLGAMIGEVGVHLGV